MWKAETFSLSAGWCIDAGHAAADEKVSKKLESVKPWAHRILVMLDGLKVVGPAIRDKKNSVNYSAARRPIINQSLWVKHYIVSVSGNYVWNGVSVVLHQCNTTDTPLRAQFCISGQYLNLFLLHFYTFTSRTSIGQNLLILHLKIYIHIYHYLCSFVCSHPQNLLSFVLIFF